MEQPVLYAIATLITGRREIVDQLRSNALWFAVSIPKAYEHGFGYGPTFEWSDDLVRLHTAQDYSKERVCDEIVDPQAADERDSQ